MKYKSDWIIYFGLLFGCAIAFVFCESITAFFFGVGIVYGIFLRSYSAHSYRNELINKVNSWNDLLDKEEISNDK